MSLFCNICRAGEVLQGLLLVASVNPRTFTKEHFRLTKLLAIPFAVAVHRARLREWAHIYADERAELIKRAEAARAPFACWVRYGKDDLNKQRAEVRPVKAIVQIRAKETKRTH
jgi:hypothetical protein